MRGKPHLPKESYVLYVLSIIEPVTTSHAYQRQFRTHCVVNGSTCILPVEGSDSHSFGEQIYTFNMNPKQSATFLELAFVLH